MCQGDGSVDTLATLFGRIFSGNRTLFSTLEIIANFLMSQKEPSLPTRVLTKVILYYILFQGILYVVYTMREEAARLISARMATPAERKVYYGGE